MLTGCFQIVTNKNSTKNITFRMNNTKKKLKGQSKFVRHSFTRSNITKYPGYKIRQQNT